MTFEEWASEYFGKNVDVPEACGDAWQAATEAAREACAKLCDDLAQRIADGAEWTPLGAAEECADSIRERSNASN